MEEEVTFTKDELEEFKKIAFEEYGIRLTDEQAFEQGFALLSLFEYVIKKAVQKKKLTVESKNGLSKEL
ncbi:MAG: hypothetical protein ABI425_01810 [Patescibacteria group bacterium]